MISFIIVIIPLIVYCTWIFFKKSPIGNKSYIMIYNSIAFLLVSVLSGYFGLNAYNKVVITVDRGWAPFIAFMYISSSFLVGILLAFLVRNFLLFRRKV